MNTGSGFRDLIVWQKSMILVVDLYRWTKEFPTEERFGLVSQIRSAAISIPANIAEGHGRSTRGEYGNQLSAARGSLKELETHCEIASRLGILSAERNAQAQAQCTEISKMLTGLKRAVLGRRNRAAG